MEREEAVEKLKLLVGKNLHDVATEYQINVLSDNGLVNKGWAGHTIERFLGLPLNSAQSPNFGSWELKVVPIKMSRGCLVYKETMAVTMIDPVHVAANSFDSSHLYSKLKKFLLVVRTIGNDYSEASYVHKTSAINLPEEIKVKVAADYDLIRSTIMDPRLGFNTLSGSMGEYIQPRTKGPGHGSISRAFYARKSFLNVVAPL